jgi:hypothetical protein
MTPADLQDQLVTVAVAGASRRDPGALTPRQVGLAEFELPVGGYLLNRLRERGQPVKALGIVVLFDAAGELRRDRDRHAAESVPRHSPPYTASPCPPRRLTSI